MLKILSKLKLTDFSHIYNIMELSFPSSEIRTYEKALDLFNHTNYQVLVSYHKNMNIDGFIAEWDYKDFRYIEHFAVHPSTRGSGLGTKMLQEYLNLNKKLIYIEVEPVKDQITKRRIQYYQRMGFFLSEFGYVQPPYKENHPEVPLKIMTYPTPILEEEFLKCKSEIFKDVYT